MRFIILLLARWTCPNNRPTYPTYLMCRIGTAKFFTLLLLLYHTSVNHAGGLRYHGMSSTLSQLYADGYLTARSVEQTAVFQAAEEFARCEGILPAPESSHAIRAAIDEAIRCREAGLEKTILFGLTGTGYFDMAAYGQYNDGRMTDCVPSEEELQRGFASIPRFPGNL